MTVFSQRSKLKFHSAEKQKNKKTIIRDWFLKWDRTIAAATALIIFCALLALVIVNIKVINDDHDKKETNDSEKALMPIYKNTFMQVFSETKTTGYCVLGTDMTCSAIQAENLCTEINKTAQQTQNSSVQQLILVGIQYTNNEIQEGWLNCTTLTFRELKILGQELRNIKAKAFNGTPFNNLQVLTLDTQILEFRREMFEGLYLERLEITCLPSTTFEENVFGAISKTLRNLQIIKLKQSGNIDKLTPILGGNESLDVLIELDLRSNILDKLFKTSFQSATSLQILYLGHSNIKEIEFGTFDNLKLITLDLSYNSLESLENNIFKDVDKGIILLGNNWRCDCDLVWLKNLVQSRSGLFNPAQFFCNPGNIPYISVDFCPNTTTPDGAPTTSTEVTTTSSRNTEQPTETTSSTKSTQQSTGATSVTENTEPPTRPTTPITEAPEPTTDSTTSTSSAPKPTTDSTTSTTSAPKPVNIPCIIPNPVDLPHTEKTRSLSVRDSSVIMRFYFSSNWVLQVEGEVVDINLLWFKSDDISVVGCLKNLEKNNQVEINFFRNSPNQTFIFCLVPSKSETVSPFDCNALHIPSEEDEDILLKSDAMVPLICGACASLLLVSVITGLIVFYCIRQNPSLIKGNKRVIIVESEAADAIVMPPYYDKINYKPPSLNSYSNGYLTPKYQDYYTPPRSSSTLRTVSERTDYNLPSTSSGRIRKNFYKRKTRIEHFGRNYDENLYEPPPLPPNHPSRSNLDYSRV